MGEAERPAQVAGMAGGGEGLDGLVQRLGLADDAALPPVALVCDDGIGELVPPMVLMVLVSISAPRLGRVQERQAQDVVGG